MNLAYLMPNHVKYGLRIIHADYSDVIAEHRVKFERFFRYYEYWMKKINEWNVYHLNDHTTNNTVEGWHRGVKRDLIKNDQSLPFWQFIKEIGTIAIENELRISQLEQGQTLRSPSLQIMIKNDKINAFKVTYTNESSDPDPVKVDNSIRKFMNELFHINDKFENTAENNNSEDNIDDFDFQIVENNEENDDFEMDEEANNEIL